MALKSEISITFDTFEFIVTPDLDEATIRDAVSGYGAAFDAIDEITIADRAFKMSLRGGMITSTGTVTDVDEIETILVGNAREEIQDRIDTDVEELMARLEEARAVIAVVAAVAAAEAAIEAAAAAHTTAHAALVNAVAALVAAPPSVDSVEAAVAAAVAAIEAAAAAHAVAVAALASAHVAAGKVE